MSVTSADVARAAGVSRATVSYVLNDAPGRVLSPETRETVLRVARELGYQPNALARSLKRGRSNTVLFPLPRVEVGHVLRTLLDACTDALAPRGFGLVRDVTSYDIPARQAEAWAELAPAAVIDLFLRHDDKALSLLRSRGVPVLSAALPDERPWESSSDVFSRNARLLQVRHLTAQGHRTITAVLPQALPVDARTEQRLISEVRAEAAAAGGRLAVVRADLADVAGLVAGWSTLPDAFAAYNDSYALAVLTALQARGVRVPHDVAVMGIDDEPLGRVVTPALTTISADFGAFAEAVADAVEAVLTGAPAAGLPVPDLQLRARASA